MPCDLKNVLSAKRHVGFALHFYLENMGLHLNVTLKVLSALVNELGCDMAFIPLSHGRECFVKA